MIYFCYIVFACITWIVIDTLNCGSEVDEEDPEDLIDFKMEVVVQALVWVCFFWLLFYK